jgi:TonB family protein
MKTTVKLCFLLLPLLFGACATGPALLDRIADRDRFITGLPAVFPVASGNDDETIMRQWAAELPAEKQAIVLTLTRQERKELHAARRPPRYPVEMRRNGITGTVELLLRIDVAGNVTDACVLNHKEVEPQLAAEALTTCAAWKFAPLLLVDQPSVGVVYEKVSFTLTSH